MHVSQMFSLILFFNLILISPHSTAIDALSIERVDIAGKTFSFPNEDNNQPEKSDFTVLHSVLMSNEEGERYAVITVQNHSGGQRILTEKHVMALLGDGSRLSPKPLKVTFSGDEQQSMTIYFGKRTFPILTIFTRS